MKFLIVFKFMFFIFCVFFTSAYAGNVSPKDEFDAYTSRIIEYELQRQNDIEKNNHIKSLNLKEAYKHLQKDAHDDLEESLSAIVQEKRLLLRGQEYSTIYVAHAIRLAESLYEWGKLKQQDHPSSSKKFFQECIDIIDHLIQRSDDFESKDLALYLKAISYMEVFGFEPSKPYWVLLTKVQKSSLYSFHAFLVLGDQEYVHGKISVALHWYLKANHLLSNLKSSSLDLMRLEYRILWSAYYSGHRDLVSLYAKKILTLGRYEGPFSRQKQMSLDAEDLWSDVLLQPVNEASIFLLLSDPSLGLHGDEIYLKILRILSQNAQNDKIIHFCKIYLNTKPNALHMPEVLWMLAKGQKEQNLPDVERMETLESIAMLMPQESLWRQTYGHIHAWEKYLHMMRHASEELASFYYKQAIKTQNFNYYNKASFYFKLLTKEFPHHEQVSQWRLYLGHSYLFSDNEDEAIIEYDKLLNSYNIYGKDFKKTAHYHVVLAQEKKWRKALSKAIESNTVTQSDHDSQSHLQDLQKSIDGYFEAYPEDARGIELLLMGAHACREQGLYKQAAIQWNRVYVFGKNPQHKILALRGLILTALKEETSHKVIDLIDGLFDQNMDLFKTYPNIRKEVIEIFDKQLLFDAKRLEEKGDLELAAQSLWTHIKKYPDLPSKEIMYRDAGYYFALQGHWTQAQDMSLEYGAWGGKKFREDMMYLLARSYEYQLNFKQSSLTYFTLGDLYPNYPKAKLSLEKSASLSLFENQHELSAKSYAILAKRVKNFNYKKNAFHQSFKNFILCQKFEDALLIAHEFFDQSVTFSDQSRAKLMMAEALCKGLEPCEDLKAQEIYISLKNQIKKERLKFKSYGDLYGESVFGFIHPKKWHFHKMMMSMQKHTQNELKEMMSLFQSLDLSYRDLVESNSSEWSARGRFEYGDLAIQFSEKLMSLKVSHFLSQGVIQSYVNEAAMIKKKGQDMLGKNLMIARSNPTFFANNLWIRKTKFRFAGQHHMNVTDLEDAIIKPSALEFKLPYTW